MIDPYIWRIQRNWKRQQAEVEKAKLWWKLNLFSDILKIPEYTMFRIREYELEQNIKKFYKLFEIQKIIYFSGSLKYIRGFWTLFRINV